jgi:hypothetical protein
MSTRERWIVYPLLFLTLGIAMRNQFLPTKMLGAVDFRAGELNAQTIRCNNLEVAQDALVHNNAVVLQELQFQRASGNALRTDYAESRVSRNRETEAKKIVVSDDRDKPVILMVADPNAKAGLIQTMTAGGALQIQIRTNETGGIVTAVGQSGQALVGMGFEGDAFGVFAQTSQSSKPFLLTPMAPTPSMTIPNISPTIPLKTEPEGEKEESK